MRAVKNGIAPDVLRSQVQNSAAWLWSDPRAAAVTRALDHVEEAEKNRDGTSEGTDYFRLLLAAHFATVGTFVPTDVDVRIRHHAWNDMATAEAVEAACNVVDEVATWDARWCSARVVETTRGPISGHDGEWLAVRAGALGRAGTLENETLVARIAQAIDDELAREAEAFEAAMAAATARGSKDEVSDVVRALSLATVIAHNLGDLSRVVEQWSARPMLGEFRARYVRLGHPDAQTRTPAFATAAHLNRAMMALENHRFLALRKARALRGSRELLLPIGPWFGAWGEIVARHESLDARARGEVAAALLEIHFSSPDQQGCLRALAGMHRAMRGGLDSISEFLPARLRKETARGRVREAVDVSPEQFDARTVRRFRSLVGEAGHRSPVARSAEI